MRHVTAREANQRFARLLSSVEDGEQVVITKRGKPVAVVSPYPPEQAAERAAAIAEFLAVLREPLISAEDFRTFSRDEMHERP
jgi:prevent-host-death family protein